jgi:very-short-patch-repair endonuclease
MSNFATISHVPSSIPPTPEGGYKKDLLKVISPEALDRHGKIKYNYKLISSAQENRNNPTKAESLFWNCLLKDKKSGYKFKQQKPIINFIADFYCSELLLVIEIDGDYHLEKRQVLYDELRTEELEKYNIKVLRYSNEEVIDDIEKLRLDLNMALKDRKQEIEKLSQEAPFGGWGDTKLVDDKEVSRRIGAN